MDFELSDEQRLLKDSVERLTTQRYDFETRKKFMAEPDGWSRGMWRQYAELGLTALPFDRATHYFLCAAIAIHLGGVDQRHAEIDSQLQRRDFALALPCPLAHLPCPQADDGHERA